MLRFSRRETRDQLFNPRCMSDFRRTGDVRCDKNETADMRRIPKRRIERNASALRTGNKYRREPACDRLQNRDQISNSRVVLCFGNCFSKSASIIGDSLVASANFAHLVGPHPAIRDASVQKHNRFSATDDLRRQRGKA